jgi:hypothetical protein
VTRVVVCGYMVRHPVAGNLLAFFNYVLGFEKLGIDVVYLEESGWPYSAYDPSTKHWVDDPTEGLRIVRALFAAHDVNAPVIYVNRETGRVDGAAWAEVKELLASSDLLLNIGGVCWLHEFAECRHRALVDLDPMFTQVERFGAEVLDDYHTHFSYGANIGKPGCRIPNAGVEWIATQPPVVTSMWQGAAPTADAPFTTISNWGAYGAIEYEGERYGQKDVEFLKILDLPSRTSQPLELAVSGASKVMVDRLHHDGWRVRDAGIEVSVDVDTYRAYIMRSRGELSVAKSAYVKSHSGWFSDRSVCYLAAGLPTILQDTGFTEWLPAGNGVLAFDDATGAVECIERVNADYALHRASAREIAAKVFDHTVVLPRLLNAALASRASAPSIRAQNVV